MEEEIAEAEISLDEKEQESEGQTEDLPPNDSNSPTLTLYTLHAYQRRMNVMFPWILLKYPFLRKLMLATLMTMIPLLNITQTQRNQKETCLIMGLERS